MLSKCVTQVGRALNVMCLLLTMLFTEARILAFLLMLVLKILIWPSSPTSPGFQS